MMVSNVIFKKPHCQTRLHLIMPCLMSGETLKKMEHIDLNGERFCVTQNLAEALRRLRQADQTEIMWIDALCIKQNDDEEKSTQVPLMGLIYEQAESVIAFLGKHDKTTPSLFWFLENLEKTDDIGRALELNHTFIPGITYILMSRVLATCLDCPGTYTEPE